MIINLGNGRFVNIDHIATVDYYGDTGNVPLIHFRIVGIQTIFELSGEQAIKLRDAVEKVADIPF